MYFRPVNCSCQHSTRLAVRLASEQTGYVGFPQWFNLFCLFVVVRLDVTVAQASRSVTLHVKILSVRSHF